MKMKVRNLLDSVVFDNHFGLDEDTPLVLKSFTLNNLEIKELKKWNIKYLVEINGLMDNDNSKNKENNQKLIRFKPLFEKHIELLGVVLEKLYEEKEIDEFDFIKEIEQIGSEVISVLNEADVEDFMLYLNVYVMNRNKYESYIYMGACLNILFYQTYFNKLDVSFFIICIVSSIGFYFGLKSGEFSRKHALNKEIIKQSFIRSVSIQKKKIKINDSLDKFFENIYFYRTNKKKISEIDEISVVINVVIDRYIKKLFGYNDITRFSEVKILKELVEKEHEKKYVKLFINLLGEYPIGSIFQYNNGLYGIVASRKKHLNRPFCYLLDSNKLIPVLYRNKEIPKTFSVSYLERENIHKLIDRGEI